MPNVKKTYKLFLDDVREPIHAYKYTGFKPFSVDDWKVVRNYEEFVEFIESKWEYHEAFPSLIAFDHDLDVAHYGADVDSDFEEKTGYDCAKWLAEFCDANGLGLPEFVCHSMNPAGKENIEMYLLNFKNWQENGED